MLNFISIFNFRQNTKIIEKQKDQNLQTKTKLQRKIGETNKQIKKPHNKLRGSWLTKHQFQAWISDICKVSADSKYGSLHCCCHELILLRQPSDLATRKSRGLCKNKIALEDETTLGDIEIFTRS